MIIITGASKGIGRYLFARFRNEGEDVIGTYNSTFPEGLDKSSLQKVNIVDEQEVLNFFANNTDRLTNIRLINCAGINYNCFAHKSDIKKWRDTIDVNLIGTFCMIRSALIPMRSQNFGRIINIASVVAQKGVPGTSAYAASKAALWGMVKAIAQENASKGITINNLNLGYFNIGMIDDVPPEIQDQIRKNIPINNQFGDPDNIYQAIKFIFNAPYLTGSSIDINGGLV